MMASFVSQTEFKIFHSIDRDLYTLLVMNLWRDPVESMQVMALWIWLERTGFDNVVKKILSLPYILVNEVADEALACLSCMKNDQSAWSSETSDIPLMQSLIEKDISVQFFQENRSAATQGVAKIVNEVCIRALSDIMQQAIERSAVQNLVDSQTMIPPLQQQQQPAVHPGLPQPGFASKDGVQSWTETEVPPDGRTMFVTFSKGYPVTEWEVRDFFTRSYGDCIESLHMQEVLPTEQSLFARIVFLTASGIELILNGMNKAKFTINGKHVWARKFVPKRPRTTLSPLPPTHF